MGNGIIIINVAICAPGRHSDGRQSTGMIARGTQQTLHESGYRSVCNRPHFILATGPEVI